VSGWLRVPIIAAWNSPAESQQRVALARALVHTLALSSPTNPLATLSLTARKIVQLFHDIVQQTDITLLVATHDATVYGAADRVLQINDGRIA